MKRRLFNLLAAVSLLLCMAIGALWARSYRAVHVIDWVSIINRRGTLVTWTEGWIKCHWGGIEIGRSLFNDDNTVHDAGHGGVAFRTIPINPTDTRPTIGTGTFWNHLGFSLDSGLGLTTNGFTRHSFWWIRFPLWLPLGLVAGVPTWWAVRRVRQKRRMRMGLCMQCGYDLRASPELCPECGTTVVLPMKEKINPN